MNTTYACLLEEITRSVFSTMLNIDLFPSEHSDSTAQRTLTASIQIAGQWTGSTVISLTPEVANAVAASMLQMNVADVNEEDRREVAAELVNMIGGNLKSLLPGPSFLSLPTIVSGNEFDVQVHRAELLDQVVLQSSAGELYVRLYGEKPLMTNECNVVN